MLRIVYTVFEERAFSVWDTVGDKFLADAYGGQRWTSIEEFEIAFSDSRLVDRVRALLYPPDRLELLVKENANLRRVGCKMSQAAIRIDCGHNAIHHLMIAVAEWVEAVGELE